MREALLIKSMCYQMHPDLYEKTPEVEFALQIFKERDKNTELAEFWLEWVEAGMKAPSHPHTTMTTMSEYGSSNGTWGIDAEKTIKNISRAIKWAMSKGYSITKDYSSDFFKVYIKTHDRLEITLIADRQSVCEAVPTGNKKIIPAVPEKIVDEVEWVCEKISFLGVE